VRIALVAAVIVLAGCGSARTTVPQQDAHRIDAEFGDWTLLPRWLPHGYLFASWHVDWGGPAGSERLVLHFRRRSSDLRWEVALSSWLRDKRVHCPQRSVRAERGFAWICGDVAISASATGVSAGDLRRVVASNHTVAPWRVPAPGYELAPPAVAHDEGFAPRRLPVGFIYTSRSVMRFYGRMYRSLTFAHAGSRLTWSVVSGRPTDCRGSFRTGRVAGQTVYWLVGNHGQSAWICFGSAQQLELSEYGFTVPRRELMDLVARFRRT
jgi:hypothetical protein